MNLEFKLKSFAESISANGIKKNILEFSENIIHNDHSQDIIIDDNAISLVASGLNEKNFRLCCWDHSEIPTGPGNLSFEKALCYFILLNSVNFCFWKPDKKEKWSFSYNGKKWDGALGLFAFLTHFFQKKSDINKILNFFQNLEPNFFNDSPLCSGSLYLSEERINILKKTSTKLHILYKESFTSLIKAAQKGENIFILKIIEFFPDYLDPFLKRAQLLTSMLHGYFGKHYHSIFNTIDDLTLFADYKVPQTLERLGIINYSTRIIETLNKNITFKNNSHFDLLVRAATIVSGEKLVSSFNINNKKCNSAQIDFKLWELSQNNYNSNELNISLNDCKNYHKVITTNY